MKLRHGGVVDSDDLSRGWLISRIVGRKSGDFDEEEAPVLGGQGDGAGARPKPDARRWGPRGISVSADEDVHEHGSQRVKAASSDPESQPLADPTAFEDDEDSDAGLVSGYVSPSGVRNGEEWRDDHGK